MNATRRRTPRCALQAFLLGALLSIAASADAKTTGVNDDPAVQTGPCYQALVDKNAANPTTAPNRELGAACLSEHDDVERAWARVIRLWGSDSADVPDYDSYRADAPLDGVLPNWLALAGVLLVYAVLGTPMRSAARLLGAYPGPAWGAATDVVGSLILRAVTARVFVALFGLPYLAPLGGLGLIAWMLLTPRRSVPVRAPTSDGAASVSLSARLAEAINDALGAGPGLVAISLFVQRDLGLLAIALGLALVVSAGPVLVGRRALRALPFGAQASAALLAAALGEAVILTPSVTGWIGGWNGLGVVAPLALAALTFALGWRSTPAPTQP